MQPIVIAAGGTGGHFFPAEALAAALIARGERVVLMADARSGGLSSPVFANAERYVISGAGLAGRGLARAMKGGAALLRGTAQARGILQRLQPGAVVAFGGYPAVPPVLAARSLRLLRKRPVILLHEQNAVLGRANRLLARAADRLLLNFPNTLKIPDGIATAVLGNPVRPAIAALSGEGYAAPAERINLLCLGGSLGAKIFSSLVPAALALLPVELRQRIHLTMQCRAEELPAAEAMLRDAGIEAALSPFFENVAALLAAAHLVIARAGASTIAELSVAGRPAILIPLPSAIDDHQRANADALVAAGGGWRFDQAGLTPQILADKIKTLLNQTELLTEAAAASSHYGRPDAASDLADLVQDTMAGVTSQ